MEHSWFAINIKAKIKYFGNVLDCYKQNGVNYPILISNFYHRDTEVTEHHGVNSPCFLCVLRVSVVICFLY